MINARKERMYLGPWGLFHLPRIFWFKLKPKSEPTARSSTSQTTCTKLTVRVVGEVEQGSTDIQDATNLIDESFNVFIKLRKVFGGPDGSGYYVSLRLRHLEA